MGDGMQLEAERPRRCPAIEAAKRRTSANCCSINLSRMEPSGLKEQLAQIRLIALADSVDDFLARATTSWHAPARVAFHHVKSSKKWCASRSWKAPREAWSDGSNARCQEHPRGRGDRTDGWHATCAERASRSGP